MEVLLINLNLFYLHVFVKIAVISTIKYLWNFDETLYDRKCKILLLYVIVALLVLHVYSFYVKNSKKHQQKFLPSVYIRAGPNVF